MYISLNCTSSFSRINAVQECDANEAELKYQCLAPRKNRGKKKNKNTIFPIPPLGDGGIHHGKIKRLT